MVFTLTKLQKQRLIRYWVTLVNINIQAGYVIDLRSDEEIAAQARDVTPLRHEDEPSGQGRPCFKPPLR